MKPKKTALAARVKDLKQKILRVFSFEKITGRGDGYKFKIEYQQKCPEFRFNCPLSRKFASQLLKIFPPEETPLVCTRYANFLR